MAKKKKNVKEMADNKLPVILITVVVVLLAVILGARVNGIKQELAKREAYNEKVDEELSQEKERAAKLEEQRNYVQTDSYIIEMAREKLGLVFPDEIAIKAEN